MDQQVTTESSAAQSYLSTIQSIIERMSDNSARCKTWCATLVSAILALHSEAHVDMAIAYLPVIAFFFLDSYYLALEKQFIEQYRRFVRLLHSQEAHISNLFIIESHGGFMLTLSATTKTFRSFSTSPFYGLLIVTTEIIRQLT